MISVILIALAFAAGTIDAPMIPLWVSALAIGCGLAYHVIGDERKGDVIGDDRKGNYTSFRNIKYHECSDGLPVTREKAYWADFVFNLGHQEALLVVGFFDHRAWIILVATIGWDSLIHAHMKFKFVADPPGWPSTRWVLMPSMAFLAMLAWSQSTGLQMLAFGSLGSLVLPGNFIFELVQAKKLRGGYAS